MIAGLLRDSGRTVHLGGNIGRPLLADVETIKETDFAVVELSSFQLMTMQKSPSRAVLTNLSPNHLDVHTDMDEYVEAKNVICRYQNSENLFVTNLDNDLTRTLAQNAKAKLDFFTRQQESVCGSGCFLKEDVIWYSDGTNVRCVLTVCTGTQKEDKISRNRKIT